MQNPDLVETFEVAANKAEDVGIEVALDQRIPILWLAHKESKIAARRSKRELAEVRRELAAHLFAMKSLLAKSGRSGLWSSFLRKHNIPRTSGDRIASSHEASLKNASGNCSTEAIPDSTEIAVQRFVQRIRPQLSKILTSKQAAFLFICAILERLSDVDCHISESYLEVHCPNEQPVSALPT